MKLLLFDILTQNILTHPFISLRRTCQVNRECSSLVSIQPFTLIPFIYHQQKKQGFAPQFKGLSSELMVKALLAGTETVISNYTKWPKEFSDGPSLDNNIKHIALKALTVTLNTPFLCSSVIETVQSAIVVKDRPAFVECLKEGFLRLLHLRYMPSTRMLPIWVLIGPTILYHVSHVIVVAIVNESIFLAKRIMSPRNYSNESIERSTFVDYDDGSMFHDESIDVTRIMETAEVDKDYGEITTAITATLIADVALFPIETIMHSLYLQGSRVIIDNCDETTVVLPVITNYDGFVDCYQSIIKREGTLGLYKGLGGVFLQFGLHYIIIRLAHYLIREFTARKFPKGRPHSDITADMDSVISPDSGNSDNYSLPSRANKSQTTYRLSGGGSSQNRSLPSYIRP